MKQPFAVFNTQSYYNNIEASSISSEVIQLGLGQRAETRGPKREGRKSKNDSAEILLHKAKNQSAENMIIKKQSRDCW